MAKLRKFLALVLVCAMTFTMLPVFAAADEVAAVETVEAPAAEAPAAEPAAAPVEPAAVEEVAEISAAPAEAAPVAEAIETVAAETVAPKAELQGSSSEFADDAEAVEAGYYWKLVAASTTWYNDLTSVDAKALNTSSYRLYQLCDVTIVSTSSSSTPLLALDSATAGRIDLQNHTLTAKTARPVIGRTGGYTKIYIDNGTIIHQNGYAGASAYAAATLVNGAYSTVPTTSTGSSTITGTVSLTDVTVISLAHYAGIAAPALLSTVWNTNVTLTRATLIAEDTQAIRFDLGRSSMALTAAQKSRIETTGHANCNVTLNGACTVGSMTSQPAIGHKYNLTAENTPSITFALNVTVNDPTTVFYGSAIADKISGAEDLTVTVTGTDSFVSESTSYTLPDAATITAGKDNVPSNSATPTSCTRWGLPLSCAHEHVTHHDATAASWAADGNLEYWSCDDCAKIFSDSACTTEVSIEDVTLAKVKDDVSAVAAGMVLRWDKPDGDFQYYSNTRTAVADASAVVVTGGSLHLLRDYTIVDDVSNADPWLCYSNNPLYTTTEDGMTVYGFWFDLGGYTLTAKVGRGMIGRGGAASVNVRNGTMIWQNNGRSAAVLGQFLFGYTGTSPYSGGMLVSRVTLKNVNSYALANAVEVSSNKAAGITASTWTNQFKLYNSKLIATDAQGIRVVKSSATLDDGSAGLTAYQTNGALTEVELHDGSVVGSVGSFASIMYTKTGGGTTTGIEHKLQISVDGPSNYFLGTSVRTRDGIAVTYIDPAGDLDETTYSVTMPDATTIAAETGSGKPSYLEAADVTARHYVPHVHSEKVTFHEAQAATYAAPGNNAYYACTCGKYFADAECLTELDWDSDIVIPQLVCSHASKEHHDAVAPTFAAAGTIEYWSCPDCLKLFSDEACETEITEDDLAVAALTPADAAGKTDEQLVALGAVVKTVAPDTTVKAYTDIADGYTEAKTWTAAGGTLYLLTDVTIESEADSGASGYIAGKTYSYDDTSVAGMPTKGFWFDLGGHTIDARLAKGLFYAGTSAYFNLKNGTILFSGNGRGNTSIFGAFTIGYSSLSPIDGEGLRAANINLYQLNIYTKTIKGASPAAVSSAFMNTTVNVNDCTLITNNGKAAVEFIHVRNQNTTTNDAYNATGANFIVNITGGSVLGRPTTGDVNAYAVYATRYDSTVACVEGVAYTVTVNADSDTTFLGVKPTGINAFIWDNYTVTIPTREFVRTTRNLAIPELGLEATDWNACVSPAAYVTTDLAAQTTDAVSAKATLTYGTNTAYFANASDAFAAAEKIGATTLGATVTLNDAVTSAYALGTQTLIRDVRDTGFTLNLNGQDIPAAGLFDLSGASGNTVTVTMAGAGTAKLFASVPELTFAANDEFTVAKGSMFSSWSLNLEDSVTINLYTATADPDAVYYVLDGTQHAITAKDAADAWVIDTLSARQMSEEINAYALKKSGATTTIDFANNISVKGYVEQNPASQVEEGGNHDAIVEALNATLDTMMIYGKLAEKFFGNDFTDLNAADLDAIGVDAVPETVTSNLEHADRVVTGMGDHKTDPSVTSGFWGSSAVLEDSINLKFYFYGVEFDSASATVQIGEAAATAATLETSGDFKYVQTAVAAKDFDTAITVAVEGVGSVTDSVEAYTARIGSGENHYKLAQAMRAYGADAKRFYEAKNP